MLIENVDVLPSYPRLLQKIVNTLHDLPEEKWENRTVLPNWHIKDITAHIASGALRKLTSIYSGIETNNSRQIEFRMLVQQINERNENWVSLLRSLHSKLLVSIIDNYYCLLIQEFIKMDPKANAKHAVAWAGDTKSENWFDIAREYTELWHHSMQIADSLDEISFLDDIYFTPFIETCFLALPFHYRNVKEENFKLLIEIDGMDPGKYSFIKQNSKYTIEKMVDPEDTLPHDSNVQVTKNIIWKILTGAATTEEKEYGLRIDGNMALGTHLKELVCIMI